MIGWIKIHREINNHWIWENSDYLKWWLDILIEANYSEGDVLIKGTVLKCHRGQKLYSIETWSKRWKTNKSKANRFLKLLEKEKMIELKNETHTTRLTICKYDDYQDKESTSETQTKHKRNVSETEVKSIKEDKEIKESLVVLKKPNRRVLLSDIDISSLDEETKVYFNIAIGFRDLFIKNKKRLGINDFKDQEKATFKGYVDPIRLSFTQDKKTEEDFRKVYAFLVNDEFWMKTIMSTSKLREKMSQLLVKSSSLNKKQILPSDFWVRELSDEQKKLLSDKDLATWERQKTARLMEGGRMLPIKIEYEK